MSRARCGRQREAARREPVAQRIFDYRVDRMQREHAGLRVREAHVPAQLHAHALDQHARVAVRRFVGERLQDSREGSDADAFGDEVPQHLAQQAQ